MAQHVFTGTVAPSTTPARVGDHYVDTVAVAHYVSVGTASSADWQRQGTAVTANFSGSGSPEGVVTASVGATYLDISNTGNPGWWVKAVGTGNTGWRNMIAVGP